MNKEFETLKFLRGWNNFCKKVNFADSALDADAIVFMNEFTKNVDIITANPKVEDVKTYTALELWGVVFNTDLEEAVLSHLELEKDFVDMGTDEENADIVAALEGFNKGDILDWYCQYEGNGLTSGDFKYLISEQLDIQDIREIEEWEN